MTDFTRTDDPLLDSKQKIMYQTATDNQFRINNKKRVPMSEGN
jgi:hypothetical protein